MKKIIAVLVVGLLGGGAAGWFGHERLAPELGLEGEEVEALVIEEGGDEERLVLTLEAGERTLLASFIERRQDVAALVSEGDTILLRVPRNGPFADDPAIVEVRRSEGHAADSESDDPSADEVQETDSTDDAAAEDEAAEDDPSGDEASDDAAAEGEAASDRGAGAEEEVSEAPTDVDEAAT